MRGIKNLFELYLPIVDEALIFDNSFGKHQLIADKETSKLLGIMNQTMFSQIKKLKNEN